VKLLEGVKKLRNGNYTFAEIRNLKELAQTMQVASKCGLGQSSPNSFLSVLDNFSAEIFQHNGNGVHHE
jgi:[NiFe] hydrogenase diaphorase moiety large subunit